MKINNPVGDKVARKIILGKVRVDGMEDRFHFFDNSRLVTGDEANSALDGPSVEDVLVGLEVDEEAVVGGGEVLHDGVELEATVPLSRGGGRGVAPFVTQDGETSR